MKIKKSFRFQWALIFVLLTSICILASILVSNMLLKRYYHGQQIENIEQTYNTINSYKEWKDSDSLYIAKKHWPGRHDLFEEFWNSDTLKDIFSTGVEKELAENVRIRLDRISSLNNVTLCILDADDKTSIKPIYTSVGAGNIEENLVASIVSYVKYDYDVNSSKTKVIKNGSAYTIYQSRDSHIELMNYDLVGLLDGNKLIFIRKNYEYISSAASVATNFFGYVGLVMIFIEAIVVIVLLRRFARPIVKMNEVAKRMTELDFDVKAEVTQTNEIGELAESLNTLSLKLEKTIIELKNANNELRVDLEKREEIDEMRKEFLGNVSHELKTPIAIIQGYAEGIKENVADDAESRDYYCDVIIDEATKMNTMVLKLISLTRIEQGESQIEMSRFNIVEVIKGVINSLEIMAGDRKIDVSFDVTEPCYVYADEYMMEECITNYLSNAYHYVDDGGRIEITLVKDDNIVRLNVFNSGSHVPEDAIDKIWLKFYKVDKARTREYGGSGIGLSIVKAIANLHGRSCGVYNTDDGVTFYIDMDINPNNASTEES